MNRRIHIVCVSSCVGRRLSTRGRTVVVPWRSHPLLASPLLILLYLRLLLPWILRPRVFTRPPTHLSVPHITNLQCTVTRVLCFIFQAVRVYGMGIRHADICAATSSPPPCHDRSQGGRQPRTNTPCYRLSTHHHQPCQKVVQVSKRYEVCDRKHHTDRMPYPRLHHTLRCRSTSSPIVAAPSPTHR